MRNILFLTGWLLFTACTDSSKEETSGARWLNKKINLEHLVKVTNTYHMFDSTGTKVGSMIFDFEIDGDQLQIVDTSQFDDGSVYETATFDLDLKTFKQETVDLSMTVGKTNLSVQVEKDNQRISGMYQVTRDTAVSKFPIDSVYSHDIFRSELYTFMHTLDYKKGDTIYFKAIVPTSMTVSDGYLTYEGEESIEVPAGSFECDVIWLKADGKMPDNKVWIRKETPRRIVKFYVPGPGLDIELVSSQ